MTRENTGGERPKTGFVPLGGRRFRTPRHEEMMVSSPPPTPKNPFSSLHCIMQAKKTAETAEPCLGRASEVRHPPETRQKPPENLKQFRLCVPEWTRP